MFEKRLKELGAGILRNPWIETVTRSFPEDQRRGLFLVGGALRDAWLGRPMKDLDFVVKGDVQAIAGELAQRLSARCVVLDERWGVVRLICNVRGPVKDRVSLDFSSMQGSGIVEDLARRDFTCNAMAVCLADRDGGQLASEWLDPFGGLRDLETSTLRMVRPSAFREDPLRMLRAFRIACSLGLQIDAETLVAVRSERHSLTQSARERIGEELFMFLSCSGTYVHLLEADRCGLLSVLFPEVDGLKGLEQSKPHHVDAWQHTLETFRCLERCLEKGLDELSRWDTALHQWVSETERTPALLKMAALFHDIGKPQERSRDSQGGIHFYWHDKTGADRVAAMMERIRASRIDRDRVRIWVRYHMGPIHMTKAFRGGHLTERAKVRFLRRLGPDAPGNLLISLCDVRATGGVGEEEDWKRSHFEVLDSLFSLCIEKGASCPGATRLVSGSELMDALGLCPGPDVGRILRLLDEARLEGKIHDRAGAIEYAYRFLKEG